MKITNNGVIFTDYQRASPGTITSSFTDRDGATLLIDTGTLIRMYDLCKFDLERKGAWSSVMARADAFS